MMHRFSQLTLLLSAGLLVAACAEERAPIDRVQPDAVPKNFFIGDDYVSLADDPEFYTQGTLIDVGWGAGQDGLFTSTYAQPMSRIKWVVQEDQLIARITYERIDDSDGKGAGADTDDGVIAAAYRIEKHFDIVYAYNSTTGERLNIINENTTDRPWYEREYMRVDWSRNLASGSYDFDTLSQMGIYGGVTYEPLAYYVNDPSHRDAPVFDYENGYFDVTVKAFATPKMIDLSHFGWGIDAFPACWLENDFLSGNWPAGNCNPVELTIRESFKRVTNTDFEPSDWDGYRFQAYGGFYVERFGYSRNYGMSDDKWHRFLAKYNIWERSHHYANPETLEGPTECFTPFTTPFGADPHRDLDGDGTEDECQVIGAGSKCDEFSQKCTLPFRDRVAKPVVWHYTGGSDLRYYESSEWATHEWDVAMRMAIRTARYSECVGTGGENCANEYPVPFGQQAENEDAIALSREVDDCRNGRAYADRGQDRGRCDALADELGVARGYSTGVISIAKMDEAVVLCHSPVEANDHAACGTARLPAGITAAMCESPADEEMAATCGEALSVRMGDLRYHQINVIPTPQTPSPWGIYTDAEDPLTGETISASINVWSAINDRWSQGTIDTIRYISGELETDEITDGEYVRRWAEASEAANRGGVAPKMTKNEVNKRLASFVKSTPEAIAQPKLPLDSLPMKRAKEIKQELKHHVRAKLGAASTNQARYAARAEKVAGSELEAELMTPMMQQIAGVQGMPINGAVMDFASPLRGGNPSIHNHLKQMHEEALGKRGACVRHEAPAPVGMVGLGKVLEAKFGAFDPNQSEPEQQERAEKMRDYLAQRAHYSVIAHEMGHSIGMRHNFVSSADAWGYRPQYWQLRTKNGSVTAECTDLQAEGSGCVGPRYFDPITQEEDDNLLYMFMHSSVMDYAGELTQDMLGLGAYDFAAARMFYGDVVAVHADPSYNAGTPRGSGMLDKVDNFGGIVGMIPTIGGNEIHYSQLQTNFELIKDCTPVNPFDYKPAGWDTEAHGEWHPVFDGKFVQVNGEWTSCEQQPVDYVGWNDLRLPTPAEAGNFYRGGGAIDDLGRTRVPYGFATDGWADLGNLSVYRQDNGADAYELFDFLITQQEVNHIFTNYRRNRQDFSVKSAVNRTLWRYNGKLRDAAKGIGLFATIYREVSLAEGYEFDSFWKEVAPFWFKDNIIASGIGFDHFSRMSQRPQNGPHYSVAGDSVLRSAVDAWGTPTATQVIIPNGATGFIGSNIAAGGAPLENALADDQGEFDSNFTTNAGSYYGKIWTAMLFTESVDNFISSSRSDFYDARYRSVSMADLFPDGYRRWLANNLTGDDEIKGPRLVSDASGDPMIDGDSYPQDAIGWTSWWTEQVQSCFPGNGSTVCSAYGSADSAPFEAKAPANVVPIDPQIGWEQQKFYIALTLMYLPENQRQTWIDMMNIYELGNDADPAFTNRIEFHNPTGKSYIAKTFGKEEIFGKTVQKGIAARVLEYANGLVELAYETDPGPDLDGDGSPDWFIAKLNPATGQPIVRYDSTISHINAQGGFSPGRPGCDATDNSDCNCEANKACIQLSAYSQVPFFLRQAMTEFGMSDPEFKGIF